MTERPGPEYVGDGVYVSFDGYHFWLHLGSHDSPPVVALEPDVLVGLVSYVRRTYRSYDVEPPI